MPRCRAATQHVLCVTEVTNTEKKRRGEDAGTAPRNETALAHQLENAQRTVADLQGNPQEEGGANPKVVINYEAFAGKIPRHPTSTQTCAEDPLIRAAGDHGQDIQAIAEAGLQFLGSALDAAGGQ
jgi:hypothetical protein